jgi:hypothetical protein
LVQIVYGHLVYFSRFGIFGLIKILQPWNPELSVCQTKPSLRSIYTRNYFQVVRQLLTQIGLVSICVKRCPATPEGVVRHKDHLSCKHIFISVTVEGWGGVVTSSSTLLHTYSCI